MGTSGAFSMDIRAAARSVASWCLSVNVPAVAYTSIMGIALSFRLRVRTTALRGRGRCRRSVDRARSGLRLLGREPQRARVDSVGVNRQHPPVEFLRRGGLLVEPV